MDPLLSLWSSSRAIEGNGQGLALPKLAFLSRAHSGIWAGSWPGCVKARVEELLQRFSLWVATSLSYPPKNSPRSPCPRTLCLGKLLCLSGREGWGPGCQQSACCLPRTRLQLGMAFRGQEQRYWTFLSCPPKSGCYWSSAPRIPSLTVQRLSTHCMPDTQHAVWNQV